MFPDPDSDVVLRLLKEQLKQSQQGSLENSKLLSALNRNPADIGPWKTTTTPTPEISPWKTETIQGDAGKFAQPNAADIQLPEKMPMQSLGMPGPNALLGMAQNTAKAIPEYLKDIYARMQRAVTQGPYSSPTGEYDPSIGTLPLEVMMPGYGRAVGLGSSGGRFRGSLSGKKTGFFSNDVRESMVRISEKLGDVPEKLKIQAFRDRFPHYDGSDSTIRREFARTEGRGMYARPSHEIELGAFGGQGRLKTDSPGEAIGRLQEQLPVTKQWVEEWAKDTGLETTTKTVKKTATGNRRGQPTHYVDLKDPSNPENIATVRIPTDPMRHHGYPNKNKSGQYYDTGLLTQDPKGSIRPFLEDNLINQGGISYANREAMDEALRLKFSKAPHNQNWLTSPDAAPRVTPPGQPTPPRPRQDPNQLKLLSGGFTPYDILKILEQQNGPN